MARMKGISAISCSTLLLVFLLISNAECRTNPNALAADATTPVLTCSQVYGAQIGDTCSAVGTNFGLSAESFSALNPNLNCEKIFVGQWLCLSS